MLTEFHKGKKEADVSAHHLKDLYNAIFLFTRAGAALIQSKHTKLRWSLLSRHFLDVQVQEGPVPRLDVYSAQPLFKQTGTSRFAHHTNRSSIYRCNGHLRAQARP